MLVEPNPIFTACPFSNAVIAGLRDRQGQRFGYDAIRNQGIALAPEQATAVEAQARASPSAAARRSIIIGSSWRTGSRSAGTRCPVMTRARQQ